jgi:predicted AlkP superfamily phosphohydrolase/phosphomutase
MKPGRPVTCSVLAVRIAGRPQRGVRAAVFAACFATITACDAPRPPGRVLLVGVDGASMRVVGPLLEAGRLPNFASLAQRGVHGTLRSQHPINSPPIWNSIVTGVSPKKHGISTFAFKDEDGARHLFLSTDRKVPAVWNILSAAGFSVGVVNFWNTYPPDRVNGVMISDHVLAREVEGRAMIAASDKPQAGTTVYPETWAERIEALLDSSEPLTGVPNPFLDNDALPHWLKKKDLVRRYEEDTALARIALEIERELRPDLLMVLLPGVDRVSHHLWGNVEPPEKYPPRLRPSDAERAAGLAALHDYYRYVDEILGLLMADFGPDDLVLVLSDHGFEAGTSLMVLTGAHDTDEAIDGILFAAGAGVAPPGGAPGEIGVRDVTPTLLAWFGVPIGDDMDGVPMPFLAASKRAMRIASHQGTPIEKVTSAASGAEDEIIERLRSLGYLEEPTPEKPAPPVP